MAQKAQSHEGPPELRRRAEANLGSMIMKTVPSLAPENVEALVHELRVHQIELQLQNEELKRAQADAEETRDKFRDLYEAAPFAYVTLDREGRILDANAAAEWLLGTERSRLVGTPFTSFVQSDDVERAAHYYHEVLQVIGRHTREIGLDIRGKRKTVLVDGCFVNADSDSRQLRLAVIDITERKKTEDRLKLQDMELRESRNVLQELNARLFSMEEDVRQDTAKELQEGYSQRLIALMVELSTLEQQVGLTPPFLFKLQEVKRHISRLSVDLQHLSHDLHSRFLAHIGLPEAMKEYIDELNLYARPVVDFEADETPAVCRPERAVALFRVMQEALSNVSKHSQAKAAAVALKPCDGELVMTVRYTGRGFESGARSKAHAGFGLITMRERLRAVGGRFSVESHPGRGTTVKASVPLETV